MLIFLPSFLSHYLSLSMNNFYPVPFLDCLHTVCYKFWLWVNSVWHSSRNIFLQNVLALPTDFYLLHVPQKNQYSLLFGAPMNLLLFLNICFSYFQNFVVLLLLSLNSTISYVSKKSEISTRHITLIELLFYEYTLSEQFLVKFKWDIFIWNINAQTEKQ